MAPKDKAQDPFSVESEITELKVNVARVDERLKSMSDTQDRIEDNVTVILTKIDSHAQSINKYKNDRNWIVGIFSILYGGVLAWLEYHSK